MRFIHSADWQIGMRAIHAGEAAKAVRDARLTSAQRICQLAARENVDFLLLAGDTFEDNSVDRELVEKIGHLLSGAGCPVYVLPGNHDPLVPGSVWEHNTWRSTTNVTVLSEAAPLAVKGGVLLPCPLRMRRSQQDPTAWISPSASRDEIRVVVAHGNVGERIAEDGGFPIPMDAPARAGADYVALGHWHSTLQFGPRLAYSGTHEQTRFGEGDSGNVLVVSIATAGATPEVREERTGELRWRQIGIRESITTTGRLAEIARELAQMPDPEKTLIEVVLNGLLFECDHDEVPRIEKATRRFLHARVDRAGLKPAPNDQNWIDHLPSGVAQIAAARLRTTAAGSGADAAAAMQALFELYTLAEEVRL